MYTIEEQDIGDASKLERLASDLVRARPVEDLSRES